jgi:hypothetical protein
MPNDQFIAVLFSTVAMIGFCVLMDSYLERRRSRNVLASTRIPTGHVVQSASTTGSKWCLKCGKMLPIDASFCSQCGEKQV